MFCSDCGAAVSDGARFCPACGASASAASSPPLGRQRPVAVTLLAVLKVMLALCWLLLGAVWPFAWQVTPSGGPVVGAFAMCALVMAALSSWCAYGLWTLKPSGRILQIAFSCLGLIVGFPLGTVISILILVYMFQPGVRLLFSTRPVESLDRAEAELMRAASASKLATAITVAVLIAFLAIPLAGIVAAIAIPNFLNAVDRGKQKRTMADLRAIGTALESYAVDHDVYPVAGSVSELTEQLMPRYIKAMPLDDGWGHPFQVESSAEGCLIYSFGKDGLGTNCEEAVTTTMNDEICFSNGQFVRYPSGTQQ